MTRGSSRGGTGPELVGPLYLDTSALVKLYLREAGSDALDRALLGRRDLVVSDLSVTETASALGRRLREGLPRELGARVYRRVLDDMAAGFFLHASLDASTHREAERLLLSAADIPLRSLDALHVALALGMGAAAVVTYDRRLSACALSVGLRVHPRLAS